MFYFGGMTLGYLTPPAPAAKAEDGGKMASPATHAPRDTVREASLSAKALIGRANWFSFYW